MVTVAMLSGHAASPSAPAQATSAPKNECTSLPLVVMVSTETGGGTARFREGDYLSAPDHAEPDAAERLFSTPAS